MPLRSALSPARLALAGSLLLVYAAPLFWPPGPVWPAFAANAPLLERLFPGIPPLWVAVRLVALAVAAVLLSGGPVSAVEEPFRPASDVLARSEMRVLRRLALVIALLHAASAPSTFRLGTVGQTAYLLMLVVPALLLALSTTSAVRWQPLRSWDGLAAAAVIVAWTLLRLASDLGSPRVADTVDGWRAYVDIAVFLARADNFLTDLLDPELPGLGAVPLFFQGLPVFHSGIVPLSVRSVQVFQILWLAASAAGVGVLARLLVGPGASLIAVAAFLVAPFTRFVGFAPGPFLVGPLYGTAIALCAVVACRRRSEAALAALGAFAGIALTYPGVVPTAVFLVAWTVWQLRGSWRSVWIGYAAGLASFAAAVVPALPNVLNPGRMAQHLHLHGAVTVMEPALLGQAPVGALQFARSVQVWRPFDVVVGALLDPFANPRTAIRLWGDAIFDPVGAALMGIALVACIRFALRSSAARLLLLFFAAALCPAFVSPVDRVDIIHAVVLPVPAALLAAAGFMVLEQQLDGTRWRRHGAVVAAVLICAGGTVLFDVVNPRILGASSVGIVFRAVQPDAANRVVVLDYPKEFSPDVRWLFTGPMTAFAGERPVGFLEYGGGELPLGGLAAEGKDLLFWSPGLEQDVRVTDAVCAQSPGATLYEIWDEARLDRVHGARVGAADWEPRVPTTRWRRRNCASRGPSARLFLLTTPPPAA